MLSNQCILRGGGSNPGRDAHQCHICVSFRRSLNFSSMRNSQMVVVQNIFRIFKNGTNYLELHRSCWAALSKNSVGSNFPKKLQDPHLIQKSPPAEETDTYTQTKLSERKRGMWGGYKLMPFQCKYRQVRCFDHCAIVD